MRTRRLLTLTAAAWLIPAVLAGSVATAGTAAAVLLGRANTAPHATILANPHGTPLALRAASSAPPLWVNSSIKVNRLDADFLDGLDSSAFQRRVWQVFADADGSVQSAHPGISVARNNTGDYTVLWNGFPGQALPFCVGIGRSAVVVSLTDGADGTGSARLSFDAADTSFACALIPAD